VTLERMFSNGKHQSAWPAEAAAGPRMVHSPQAVIGDQPIGLQSARANHYTEEFLRRVGLSDVPVLLQGETGVGKEVMARRLWAYSSRSRNPFLKLNCTALPSDLIESELFGYDKGAFTGATADKPGKFELAQNGTILLDEIGDMDIRLQAKLLQVLQDGEVQPLGSGRLVKVNVRVMAATHRDLRACIAQGSFREDLYYRLSVINITVSPLRERREEILPLAEKLLLRHMAPGSTPPEIPEALRQAMLVHPWPGNVRELENFMRRMLIYLEANQDATLLIRELADSVEAARRRRATDRIPEGPRTAMRYNNFAEVSRTAESKLLLEALEAARWNRRKAALRLNLDYKALLYKLRKYGIVDGKARPQEQDARF
jgi:transcriptional regulator with PAS, ATPase and Fis domain